MTNRPTASWPIHLIIGLVMCAGCGSNSSTDLDGADSGGNADTGADTDGDTGTGTKTDPETDADSDDDVDSDVPGTVYYVDKDSIGGACSDDGTGEIDSPWCTIGKANNTLQAGDLVYIRAGEYTETISPANSGTSDEESIIYLGHDEEEVIFTHAVYCIRLQSRSYITIGRIDFVDCERNLYLENSSHNWITDCTFDNPAGPVTWAGSRIYENATYNRITGNTFSRYGNESDSQDDSGAILDIGNDNVVDQSDHNLVAHNTFSYGGHHILGIYANYNVVRKNTFHNEEWYDCSKTEIGGKCGNRNVILNASEPATNIHNLIEDNYMVYSGVPPDNDSSTGLSVRTPYNIVRRNIFYHCDGAGVALSNDGGNHNDSSHNYIYHNVMFHNGYLLFDDWHVSKSGLLLARWVDDDEHNPMTGVAIKNNILHDNQDHGIYYYYVDQDEQFQENNWDEAGDPGFEDVSTEPLPDDFDALDFHLKADSPCVDNGGFLTQTTNGGQSSTEMQVVDANYFTDGLGLIEGDEIQLEGQTETAKITKVDYSANTLTLDSPLSWAEGTGISQPYWGQRPDQGVFEFDGDDLAQQGE